MVWLVCCAMSKLVVLFLEFGARINFVLVGCVTSCFAYCSLVCVFLWLFLAGNCLLLFDVVLSCFWCWSICFSSESDYLRLIQPIAKCRDPLFWLSSVSCFSEGRPRVEDSSIEASCSFWSARSKLQDWCARCPHWQRCLLCGLLWWVHRLPNLQIGAWPGLWECLLCHQGLRHALRWWCRSKWMPQNLWWSRATLRHAPNRNQDSRDWAQCWWWLLEGSWGLAQEGRSSHHTPEETLSQGSMLVLHKLTCVAQCQGGWTNNRIEFCVFKLVVVCSCSDMVGESHTSFCTFVDTLFCQDSVLCILQAGMTWCESVPSSILVPTCVSVHISVYHELTMLMRAIPYVCQLQTCFS